MSESGKVYIVGGGPGDLELITVKGLKLVREADVILYDRLAPREVLKEAKPEAVLIDVGKKPGGEGFSQEEINEMLVEYARKGLKVVRLKGGDPYVFGRGEEECIFVRSRGIECEVVPGVPSFIAAAVRGGIPLTSRGLSSSFAVVTGQEDPKKGFKSVNLAKIASAVDVVVVLMGVSRAKEILEEIASVRGYEEPAAVVIRATMEGEKIIVGTIKDLLEAVERGELENPAVIIIGKTVTLHEKLMGRS
ncbi:MAG: uroporphyrinogen-III C-methyltransferase [Acidilobaceae archaeon]